MAKQKSMKTNMLMWLIWSVMVAVFLELFLFNFRWLQSREYETVTGIQVELGEEWTSNPDGTYTIEGSDTAVIQLSGFCCEIKNIYFKAEFVDSEEKQAISYQYMVTDEANAYRMSLPELTVISSEPRSYITHMNLYGESEAMSVKLLDVEGETIRFDEIKFNVRQPLFISKLRLMAVALIVFLGCLFLPGSQLYRRSIMNGSYEDNLCVLLVLGTTIGVLVAFSLSNPYMMHRMNNTNRQYQELAECLLKGQFYLDTVPDPKLAALANPYDMDVRYAQEIAYRWDVAYFEGKYYVYFGVVPCLLFYLPYYLLTGTALVNYPVVIVEEILFCLGVFYLYRKLIQKYYPRASVACYCLLSTVTVLGSGALYLARRTDIYTVPLMCALALSVWGLALWVKATEPGDRGGLRKGPLFLGAVCIALTAGCRPQFLVSAFFAIPLFLGYLVEKNGKTIKIHWKQNWGNLLMIMVPFVVVAVALMYYNHARFGSVFDFGSGYNLTTDDMTRRGFQWRRFFLGYYTYLFQYPSLTLCAPFVHDTGVTTLYQGSTISEMVFGGLLTSNPLLLSLCVIPGIKTKLKEKGLYSLAMAFVIGAIIVVGADVQMSGMLQRYFADFAIWFFLAAGVVWLTLEELYQKNDGKKGLYWLLLVVCAITLMYNILMFFAIDLDSVWEHNPSLYIRLVHEIQFWR